MRGARRRAARHGPVPSTGDVDAEPARLGFRRSPSFRPPKTSSRDYIASDI
jgi:hypothetical protein